MKSTLCHALVTIGLILGSGGLARASSEDFEGPIAVEIRAAEASSLPIEAMEKKAREGLAKGVPDDRIARVLSDMHRDFAAVHTVLGPLAGGPDASGLIEAAAQASAEGVSNDSLRAVAQYGQNTRVLAMWALGDLVRAGLTERDAERIVSAAAHSPDQNIALSGLATATAEMLSAGVAPTQVVVQVESLVSTGRSPLSAVPVSTGGPEDNPDSKHGNGNGNANGNGNGNGNGKD